MTAKAESTRSKLAPHSASAILSNVMSSEKGLTSVFRSYLVELLWRFPRLRRLVWPVVPTPVRGRLLPAVLKRGYVEFNRLHGVPRANFAADFELYQAAELLGTVGTFRGPGALDQVIAELRDAFDDLRFTPQNVEQVDNERFVVVVGFSGTGRGSGVKVDRPIAHVWTTRGTQAARLEVYWEPAEAFEAAALSEGEGRASN